ncbi:MAG: serine hydrolase, partial [Verrucomicrobiota bacterium]
LGAIIFGLFAAMLFPAVSLFAQSAGNLQERFERYDKNEDGKLSAEELPATKLFERLDANQDGVISLEESKALGGGRPSGEDGPVMPSTSAESEVSGDFEPREHGAEATNAGLDPAILSRLDIAMEKAVAEKEVSGVVGLINRHRNRGYFEAFGWQEIETGKVMVDDAIFRLQSMSKPVVTVAALALFDAGKFDLDEPISKHLPEWKDPKVLEEGELVPSRTEITPRMLMSHSSGLYYGSLPGYPVPRTRPENLEAHSKALAARPLKFHPGEGNSYGTSIDVLGRYCEAVAGRSLDGIVGELILEPLGMTDTDFWVVPEKADRIAQVYLQPEPGTLEKGRDASLLTSKSTLFLGGQGLCSTPEDYERFCLMLLNGGELDGVRVLKRETVDQMFENQLEEIGQRYGLGAAVDGEGGYAWGGANGTQFWIDRTNDLVGIFMVQTQRYRAPTFNTFRDLVTRSLSEAPASASAEPSVGHEIEVGAAVDQDIAWKRSIQLPASHAQRADGNLAERFEQLDMNKDGKVDASELPRPEMLERMDRDGDGFITKKDLRLDKKQPEDDTLTPPESPEHTAILDQVYREIESVDPKLLSLDLYIPKEVGEKRPVMIMIHGGGWRGGDKASPGIVGAKRDHFVGAGYIYVSINYRLSPHEPGEDGVSHPDHVEDCAKAIAWIHDHVAEHGGDPDNMHLMGHSAGGHLAGLVVTNERFLQAEGKDLSIIKTNAMLDPAAVDVPGYIEHNNGRAMSLSYFHVFGEDESTLTDVSPFDHVGPDKAIPPTILFYAGERMNLDLFGPKFTEALSEAGVPSKSVDMVSLDHGQMNSHIGMVGDPMTELIMKLHAGEDPLSFPDRIPP